MHMNEAKGDQSKDPSLDAEEIRRILRSMDGVGAPENSSVADKTKYIVKSNEELRRLTAEDLVEGGKYTSIEEAMKDLKKFGF